VRNPLSTISLDSAYLKTGCVVTRSISAHSFLYERTKKLLTYASRVIELDGVNGVGRVSDSTSPVVKSPAAADIKGTQSLPCGVEVEEGEVMAYESIGVTTMRSVVISIRVKGDW